MPLEELTIKERRIDMINETFEESFDKYKECYNYLEALRKSGVTNMWGARDYLEREFDFDQELADHILFMWMNHYEELQRRLNWKR